MGKVDRKFLKKVKVITVELQNKQVVVDIDKKTEWKPESQKRNVAKLRNKHYRQLLK